VKAIIQGWSIETNPHRISSDPPTTIRLHKLGTNESHWFTIDELRAFAMLLDEAARKADDEARP
jgi:hypothetical protein